MGEMISKWVFGHFRFIWPNMHIWGKHQHWMPNSNVNTPKWSLEPLEKTQTISLWVVCESFIGLQSTKGDNFPLFKFFGIVFIFMEIDQNNYFYQKEQVLLHFWPHFLILACLLGHSSALNTKYWPKQESPVTKYTTLSEKCVFISIFLDAKTVKLYIFLKLTKFSVWWN